METLLRQEHRRPFKDFSDEYLASPIHDLKIHDLKKESTGRGARRSRILKGAPVVRLDKITDVIASRLS
jgi:hypothetical protein